MMRSGRLAVVLALIAMTASAWGETVLPGPAATIVLLVRHAEKAAGPGDDPPLTPDGRRRAEALVAVIKDTRPTAIITTQLHRAVETAQPSAAAAGVTPEEVPIDPANIPQNIAGVAAAVRNHAGETVLVVGHNNSVPAIIAALGGPQLPTICDRVYDKLFVLVLGNDVRLVQSRYGAPAPPTAGCD
jgi:broad specificity phosphatase PhoE